MVNLTEFDENSLTHSKRCLGTAVELVLSFTLTKSVPHLHCVALLNVSSLFLHGAQHLDPFDQTLSNFLAKHALLELETYPPSSLTGKHLMSSQQRDNYGS